MQLVIGGKTWNIDDNLSEIQLQSLYDDIMGNPVKVDAAPAQATPDPNAPAYKNMDINVDALKARDAPIDIKYGGEGDYNYVTTTANDIDKLFKTEFGANPNIFALPEKVKAIQSKQQGIYDMNRDVGTPQDSFYDTLKSSPTQIFAGQEATKLGIGVKGLFSDNTLDLREFESDRRNLNQLGAEHPFAKIGGTMMPYLPLGIGQGWLLEAGSKIGGVPSVMSKYRALRNLSPQTFAAGEAVANSPVAQNALFGAVIGGIDPYDTAASGALNSAVSTAVLSPLAKPIERYQNFNSSADDEVVDWARKKGFYVSSGASTGDELLQMEENALRGLPDTIRIGQNVDLKNQATTARVILNDVFGVAGDELNAKTMSHVDKAVGSELDDAVNAITGNGKILRDKLDDALGYAIGGRSGGKNYGTEFKLVDPADYAKFQRLYDKINDLVGPGYVTGEKYQKIERWIRDFKSAADNNPAYKSELLGLADKIDEGLDNSVKANMSAAQIASYDTAKTKYATKELIKRHLDQGEVNWGGLHEEMRAFNPTRYALNNAPEGSPMRELQNLLALHRINSRGAGLAVTQKVSDNVRNIGAIGQLAVDMRLRGVDPKLFAPFGFRNAQRVAGAVGSSNSETGGMNEPAIEFGKKMWEIVNDEHKMPDVYSPIFDKMDNLLKRGYTP